MLFTCSTYMPILSNRQAPQCVESKLHIQHTKFMTIFSVCSKALRFPSPLHIRTNAQSSKNKIVIFQYKDKINKQFLYLDNDSRRCYLLHTYIRHVLPYLFSLFSQSIHKEPIQICLILLLWTWIVNAQTIFNRFIWAYLVCA